MRPGGAPQRGRGVVAFWVATCAFVAAWPACVPPAAEARVVPGSGGAWDAPERLTVRQEVAIMREVRAAALSTPTPAPEPAPKTVTQSSQRGTVWDALAECESHGEWDYNEHSGWGSGIYDGGLQFDPGTWTAFGGGEYASTADQASREQQIAIAERVLAAQGWRAWPACSLELGLR